MLPVLRGSLLWRPLQALLIKVDTQKRSRDIERKACWKTLYGEHVKVLWDCDGHVHVGR